MDVGCNHIYATEIFLIAKCIICGDEIKLDRVEWERLYKKRHWYGEGGLCNDNRDSSI
jgi:hypothetical protein